MYGLAVNLIVSVSGHPWIINEISAVWSFAVSRVNTNKGSFEKITHSRGGRLLISKLPFFFLIN